MLFQLDLFLRIFLSVICGSIIGYERAQRLKAAGIRTHILVAAASALFIIISKYGFNDILNAHDIILDPSRIAAQAVSGISFIGAGTILIKNQSIDGLTTAAGLWITSGVGMALGAGLYFIGVITTILIVMIQYFLRKNHLYQMFIKKETIRFYIKANYSNHVKQDIDNILKQHDVSDITFSINRIEQGTIYLNVTGKAISKKYNSNLFIETLFKLTDISAVIKQ